MTRLNEAFDARRFVATLTQRPGVYRMYGEDDALLYVGKAKNLKKRVATYFSGRAKEAKTMALVAQIARVEVTVTNTETEALLLEHTLIKAHRPKFNVVLRDDKSYPWIYVDTAHEFPRLAFYRGPRRRKGLLFGPYPGAGAVRDTLSELQKLFQLRPCRDSFFANRSRPCLQYQINRCSGPCVGLIEPEEYAADLANGIAFLNGENNTVIENLAARMEAAADALEFEQAARFRDQIARLRRVESEQAVDGIGKVDADAIALGRQAAVVAVTVVSIRRGRVTGSQTFFPRVRRDTDDAEIMTAFVGQYYLERDVPALVITGTEVGDAALLEESWSEREGNKVSIRTRVRGERAKWVALAATNARESAGQRVASDAGVAAQLEALGEALDLGATPQRIECFDVSHTAGEAAVASCVVFGADGPLKSDYRRFNIKEAEGGDDYMAMEEAVRRRYTRVRRGESPVPDIVLIDGGKGQLARAAEVMAGLGFDDVTLVGVAKGRARRPGAERLFLPGIAKALTLAPDSPALLLIQNIRDEAHRFAITGHRQRRSRRRRESPLEGIAGLGPKRRRELLRQFGGLKGIRDAGIDDLARTHGISRALAEKIYNRFRHTESPPLTDSGDAPE